MRPSRGRRTTSVPAPKEARPMQYRTCLVLAVAALSGGAASAQSARDRLVAINDGVREALRSRPRTLGGDPARELRAIERLERAAADAEKALAPELRTDRAYETGQ